MVPTVTENWYRQSTHSYRWRTLPVLPLAWNLEIRFSPHLGQATPSGQRMRSKCAMHFSSVLNLLKISNIDGCSLLTVSILLNLNIGYPWFFVKGIIAHLYCIGLAVGRYSFKQHNIKIFSLGKERGYRFLPDIRYLFNLYRVLQYIERDGGVDIIFSHMAPIFTIALAPYALWKRVPIVQWYAHPSVTWRLRLAHYLCTQIVTSFPTSYPYKHDKVTVVGQGIDTDLFSPGQE